MTYSTKDLGQDFQSGSRFSILSDPIYVNNPGIQSTPTTWVTLVPLAKAANNIALAQTPANAGNLALTAGTGTVGETFQGLSVITLDCTRCVTITGNANTTLAAVTINGFDLYDQKVTATFNGPVGANTTTSTKAFKRIYQVHVSAGTGTNVTAGTEDVIGLPYNLTYPENLIAAYNGAALAPSAGVAADATNPATAVTGDVRGTVALASAADGTKRLAVQMVISEALKATGDQNVTLLRGVTQFASF